ncbi:MAG: hypothetical protein DYG90_14070, partial [Chloroflexi bacterium CFX6]|nr:hypothetical protein [Chloroflexi bacterium CFX6]
MAIVRQAPDRVADGVGGLDGVRQRAEDRLADGGVGERGLEPRAVARVVGQGAVELVGVCGHLGWSPRWTVRSACGGPARRGGVGGGVS